MALVTEWRSAEGQMVFRRLNAVLPIEAVSRETLQPTPRNKDGHPKKRRRRRRAPPDRNERLSELAALEAFIAEKGVTICPPACATHTTEVELSENRLPEPVWNGKTRKFRREPA